MKNFKLKTPLPSYLIAPPTCIKKHKPGQNQLLTKKPCILNVIKPIDNVNLFIFWEVILCEQI
jgi:hypothetical protein